LSPWDPWRDLARVRARIEQLWDHFLKPLRPDGYAQRESIAFLPAVDFIETGGDYRLYVSAPGFVEEDLDIAVHENSLVVRGERFPPYDRHRAQGRLAEWRYGYFERQLEFPQRIDVRQLRATYDAGVLTIVVAKANP
jgi:HSP20 family protein